jgi:hypothetical protein
MLLPMTVLALAFPLACWALAARTARAGWVVAIVLAVCAAAEIALAKGWVLAGARFTLLVAFALVAVMVLFAGIVAEGHQAGVRRLRSAGARGMAGLILSVACSAASLGVIVLFTFGVLVNGSPAAVPSGAGVLPLPGLVIAGNHDQGCSSGSQTFCSRQIQVRGTAGMPAEDVARRVRGQLAQLYGWHLTPGGPGYWTGCRVEDWLLDRHQVCASIAAGQRGVTVTVQTSDSW